MENFSPFVTALELELMSTDTVAALLSIGIVKQIVKASNRFKNNLSILFRMNYLNILLWNIFDFEYMAFYNNIIQNIYLSIAI